MASGGLNAPEETLGDSAFLFRSAVTTYLQGVSPAVCLSDRLVDCTEAVRRQVGTLGLAHGFWPNALRWSDHVAFLLRRDVNGLTWMDLLSFLPGRLTRDGGDSHLRSPPVASVINVRGFRDRTTLSGAGKHRTLAQLLRKGPVGLTEVRWLVGDAGLLEASLMGCTVVASIDPDPTPGR